VRISDLFDRGDPVSSAAADRGFEAAVGRLLGIGVLVSSACLAAGLVSALVGGDSGFSRVLLSAGLVLLMATPGARVVLSAASYLRRRDWLFAILTVVVLLQLLASVIIAFRR
jgi:uncharacterized membrane protein